MKFIHKLIPLISTIHVVLANIFGIDDSDLENFRVSLRHHGANYHYRDRELHDTPDDGKKFEIRFRDYEYSSDDVECELCIAVKGVGSNGDPEEGDELHLWCCHGHSQDHENQLWYFRDKRIKNRKNRNVCIDRDGSSSDLVLDECVGDSTKIKYYHHRLELYHEDKCIASEDDEPELGSALVLKDCDGDDHRQKWNLEED